MSPRVSLDFILVLFFEKQLHSHLPNIFKGSILCPCPPTHNKLTTVAKIHIRYIYSLKVSAAVSSSEIERVMIITLAIARLQYTHYHVG